jgi:hypothetical protein
MIEKRLAECQLLVLVAGPPCLASLASCAARTAKRAGSRSKRARREAVRYESEKSSQHTTSPGAFKHLRGSGFALAKRSVM